MPAFRKLNCQHMRMDEAKGSAYARVCSIKKYADKPQTRATLSNAIRGSQTITRSHNFGLTAAALSLAPS